eukprot:COSAG02_NODE_415_length_22762_cov_133.681816_15_plen_231_part_00
MYFPLSSPLFILDPADATNVLEVIYQIQPTTATEPEPVEPSWVGTDDIVDGVERLRRFNHGYNDCMDCNRWFRDVDIYELPGTGQGMCAECETQMIFRDQNGNAAPYQPYQGPGQWSDPESAAEPEPAAEAEPEPAAEAEPEPVQDGGFIVLDPDVYLADHHDPADPRDCPILFLPLPVLNEEDASQPPDCVLKLPCGHYLSYLPACQWYLGHTASCQSAARCCHGPPVS